uniref:Uncharacterized protein n=1 Tax=Paramormyrops kingsleyae TaxID=1676925 RepID=A0A3B3QK06_9TELE
MEQTSCWLVLKEPQVGGARMVCLPPCVSVCLSVCLPPCVSVCLSVCLPPCVSVCLLCVSLPVCLSVSQCVSLPVCFVSPSLVSPSLNKCGSVSALMSYTETSQSSFSWSGNSMIGTKASFIPTRTSLAGAIQTRHPSNAGAILAILLQM